MLSVVMLNVVMPSVMAPMIKLIKMNYPKKCVGTEFVKLIQFETTTRIIGGYLAPSSQTVGSLSRPPGQ